MNRDRERTARVRRDGQVAMEHPQFVLRSPRDPDNLLLDFGNAQARAHMLDLTGVNA